MTDAMRRIVRDSTSEIDIRTQAIADGMVTLRRDGMSKVKEGVTTINEVLRNVPVTGQ
jgi:type II secretory ATPase GspE/PulE/Tfp pilus assembly ATPase PilB-like protein